jgi:hypothetical protein
VHLASKECKDIFRTYIFLLFNVPPKTNPLFLYFKYGLQTPMPRQSSCAPIDNIGVWRYFGKDIQGNPPKDGVECIIFLNDTHKIKFNASLGEGTNNFAKLFALRLLLRLVVEHGI